MFTKIIACILSFLLWVFPWLQTTQSLSAGTVANNLMRAIETRDVDLFEEQLCLNLKVNLLKEGTEDLSDKIAELFGAIDGELAGFTWETMGGHHSSDGRGKTVRQQILYIDFSTDTGDYRLAGNFEYYNNFNPKEMGMRSILLFSPPTSATPIAEIRATHGENGMHD